jgi:hypothetical protein
MKVDKKCTLYYYYYCFLSYLPVPHLYSAHLLLLSTLPFFKRRKEVISTEDEAVLFEVIPKERGVV